MVQPNFVCPHCGVAISPNARFCGSCGKHIPVERNCPRCGTRISPTAKFCGTCGQTIEFSPQPPAAAQPAWIPPPVPGSGRAKPRKGFLILGGCAGVIMLCLIGAVGFYFAFRSGVITQKQLLNLIGLGPGTITVMNFRDDAIQAVIKPIKPSEEREPVGKAYNLDAYEIITQETNEAGKYRVDIRITKTGEAQGSCALNVRGGDEYRFVSLPNGILVTRKNSPSSDPKDLFPETSAFCR